jgi:hypothetical protein
LYMCDVSILYDNKHKKKSKKEEKAKIWICCLAVCTRMTLVTVSLQITLSATHNRFDMIQDYQYVVNCFICEKKYYRMPHHGNWIFLILLLWHAVWLLKKPFISASSWGRTRVWCQFRSWMILYNPLTDPLWVQIVNSVIRDYISSDYLGFCNFKPKVHFVASF